MNIKNKYILCKITNYKPIKFSIRKNMVSVGQYLCHFINQKSCF